MRIIAGKKRGLKLETLSGKNTRPTLDRVREALFSILGGECQDLNVLDLFAGSGSLGLEAFSRGAKKVVFVEKDTAAYAVLNQNVQKMKDETEVITCIQKDALMYLKQTTQQFDLVFLDPPYDNAVLNRVLEALQTRCKDQAVVVIETDGTYPLIIPVKYRIKNTRQYGRVQLTFIQYEE